MSSVLMWNTIPSWSKLMRNAWEAWKLEACSTVHSLGAQVVKSWSSSAVQLSVSALFHTLCKECHLFVGLLISIVKNDDFCLFHIHISGCSSWFAQTRIASDIRSLICLEVSMPSLNNSVHYSQTRIWQHKVDFSITFVQRNKSFLQRIREHF